MEFPSDSAPKGGLWLTDVVTGAATPLSAGPTQQGNPSVSHDGTKIAFASGGQSYDLVEVPLDGSSMRDFLTTASDEYSGAWVPESSRYVYLTNKNGDEELRIHSQTENWDRLILDRRHADRVIGATTGLSSPVSSPDGQHVAFDVYGAGGGSTASSIWISPAGGGDPTRLSPPGTAERAAAWSPNGQSIVCIHDEGGVIGLAVLRVGTRDPPRVIAHAIRGVSPAWSPDGQWIAYATNQDLRLVSPDGARQRVFTADGTSHDLTGYDWDHALVWSGDSKSLYSTRKTVEGRLQVIAIDAVSGVCRVVSTPGDDVSFTAPNDGLRFTLAPDGTSFLATIMRKRTDLWILENFAPRRGIVDWLRRR
jgi:Tol biopolymer transport system component